MDRIPDELWDIIVNMLNIYQAMELMYVNRTFYNIVMNYYTTHDIYSIKPVLIRNIMTRIKHVKLYMSDGDDTIFYIMKTFPNIKYICTGPMTTTDENIVKKLIAYAKDNTTHDLVIELSNGRDSKSDIEELKRVYPNLCIKRRFCFSYPYDISVQIYPICHECNVSTDHICNMCDMRTCKSCLENTVCKGCIISL